MPDTVIVVTHAMLQGYGGFRNIAERIGAMKALGFDIAVVHAGLEGTAERLDELGARQHPLPGLFDDSAASRLSPSRRRRHRADSERFLKLIEEVGPRAVMVHGQRPVKPYQAAQKLAPLFFFRHDGTMACPAGSRVTEPGRRKCGIEVGCRCLANQCWGDSNSLRKAGLVVRRRRDLRRLRRLRNVVVSSRYLARIHGLPDAEVQYPPLRKPEELPPRAPPEDRVECRIVFVGRLERNKGAGELIPIMRLLPNDYSLVIVGDGPERSALEEQADELVQAVEFHGWQPSEGVFREMLRAQVSLVPSMWDEGFGIIGPESFACGTPVVAYDAGGISEWCVQPSGILVPHGDRRAAAQAIRTICEELEGPMWPERSEAARKTAHEEFDYGRFVADIKSMLDRAEARR